MSSRFCAFDAAFALFGEPAQERGSLGDFTAGTISARNRGAVRVQEVWAASAAPIAASASARVAEASVARTAPVA